MERAEPGAALKTVDQLRLPALDPADPALKGRRWHRAAGDLAESGHWLARSPLAVIVLDRADGEFFLRSRSTVFPGRFLGEMFGIGSGPLHDQIEANIVNLEGDEHRRLRSLLNPSLSPRAANGWRPDLRRILRSLWDDLPGDRLDFVSAFSRPYPALAIARVMGAPAVDAPRLHDWSNWVQKQFDPIALADPETVATMQRKVGEFYDWIDPMIEDRREDPGDDLISSMLRTEENGERLGRDELRNLVLNILAGGVDTLQSQLAHGVRLFADAPSQWEALRADPGLFVPRAVSEILRYEPATPFTARQLTSDLEYRDVIFPAGTVLMVCSFTGNRDPDVFERPFEFEPLLEREGGRPLTFGAGIHYCVGANLARAELEEAFAFLAERVERFELIDDPELQSVSGIYGIESLEMRLIPATVS